MRTSHKNGNFKVVFLPKNIRLADRKNLVRRRGFDGDGKTITWRYGQERELIISELDIFGRDFAKIKAGRSPYIWAPRALHPANAIAPRGNAAGLPDYDFELTLIGILRQPGEKDEDEGKHPEIETTDQLEPKLEE